MPADAAIGIRRGHARAPGDVGRPAGDPAVLLADELSASRLLCHREGGGRGKVDVDATGAGLWGLVRVAQSEHPNRIVLVDLDGAATTESLVVALSPANHRSRCGPAVRWYLGSPGLAPVCGPGGTPVAGRRCAQGTAGG